MSLNDTIFCRLAPSPIHGLGVFAIRDIPEGQQLTDYNGGDLKYHTLTPEEFDELAIEIQQLICERTIFIEGKPLSFVSPNCNQLFQFYMNHSDTPNSNGRKALRDIKKGEEITEDYKHL